MLMAQWLGLMRQSAKRLKQVSSLCLHSLPLPSYSLEMTNLKRRMIFPGVIFQSRRSLPGQLLPELFQLSLILQRPGMRVESQEQHPLQWAHRR